MNRRHRLRGRRRITAVRTQGVAARVDGLRLSVAANGDSPSRVALAVVRADGAVTRNRARRRLRAAFAPVMASQRGVDVVISVPAPVAAVPFPQLCQVAAAAMQRASEAAVV